MLQLYGTHTSVNKTKINENTKEQGFNSHFRGELTLTVEERQFASPTSNTAQTPLEYGRRKEAHVYDKFKHHRYRGNFL